MSAGARKVSKPTRALVTRMTQAARRVRKNAHAPYSNFAVGAAVLDERGRIHVGCNVENASYGLSICAERSAVFAAVAAGARRINAVIVVTDMDPPATPCGACRQILAEFAPDSTPVFLAGATGPAPTESVSVAELLPGAFRLKASAGKPR